MKNSEMKAKLIEEECKSLTGKRTQIDYITASITYHIHCKQSISMVTDRSLYIYYANVVHKLVVFRAELLVKVGADEKLKSYIKQANQQSFKFN